MSAASGRLFHLHFKATIFGDHVFGYGRPATPVNEVLRWHFLSALIFWRRDACKLPLIALSAHFFFLFLPVQYTALEPRLSSRVLSHVSVSRPWPQRLRTSCLLTLF